MYASNNAYSTGCVENSDLENSDLRPVELKLNPFGALKTQALKPCTLWVSQINTHPRNSKN